MTIQSASDYQTILDFWFSDRVEKYWWSKSADFDLEIKDRFEETYLQAVQGHLANWRNHPQGRLAEIIVVDQFPSNIYRDQPEAFANDPLARACVHEAIEAGDDQLLIPGQRSFLYMPLMHSESPDDHELAAQVFASDEALANGLKFELMHKKIIDRFGRYPHRNHILGRTSTAEELEFLNEPGSSF